ncbi:MAG TPA: DUF3800 domain-containing protein [Acidobacteriaceae bacterium]|nr:DUF3800 domain-containing protein [Acidobacteriaceae bacterium]
MALFTAYFDASGNAKDQPRVVVSGYIANYGQWKLFEKSWELAHADFGVVLPFHMSEFVAALERPDSYKQQKNARQDYISIAQNADKAMLFLRVLTNIQMCGVLCGISTIIDLEIYESVSSLLDLRSVVPPYALGARMCMENVHTWERAFQVSEPVECIFESGDFEQGKFTDLMIDEGEACPIYRNKSDFAGLQAADMYAWEQANFLRKYKINPLIDARQEFGMLLHAIPKIHTHAPLEVLINLCHAKGIDPRTGIKK